MKTLSFLTVVFFVGSLRNDRQPGEAARHSR